MKFSPTATLALALATGLAGTAAAQTATNSGTASTSPQIPAPMSAASPTSPGQPGYAQPQGTAAQVRPSASQVQPSFGQAQVPDNAPNNAPNNANEQVRTAQQQLHAAGLYNGPVDGVMDPDTRAAIARFQQQNGLQPSESLDQPTLARLTGSPPAGLPSGAPAPAPMAPSGSSGNAPVPAAAGSGGSAGQTPQR